jgi:primary-amine oxidase
MHPLDALTAGEITTAVEVLRTAGRLGPEARFGLLDLAEPEKAAVAEGMRTGTFGRAARAIIYDWATDRVREAVVDLTSRTVVSVEERPGGQPPMRHLVISRINEILKSDTAWLSAVRALGVRDPAEVNMLAGLAEDTPVERVGGDLVATSSGFMKNERPESMGLPVSARLNLTRGTVLEVNRRSGEWHPSDRTPVDRGREPLMMLDITQPDGTSFRIEGSAVHWQNWTIHYAVHPRRGLELFDISYRDAGRDRPILYRAAGSETLTPYGDPEWAIWYPIDEGDYGFGTYGIRSAVPGADAPPNAVFRSATLPDEMGRSYDVPRAVSVYERDGGMLWRHADESTPRPPPGHWLRLRHRQLRLPFQPAEMHASGDYLPAGVRGGGLPAWTCADRSVDDADIVLWYTLGLTHRVRPEDYPLMPVHTASFSLVPFGFFTENPALDVAAPGAGR